MVELFQRATWNEYQRSPGNYANCRVLYITDKNMHRVRYETDGEVSYILYSEQYGQSEYSYNELMSHTELLQQLQPGLYILKDNKLYYYDGNVLTLISGASSGNNTSVDSFTIWAAHTAYDHPNYDRRSDVGNLQVQGYIEGKIDCGEWK